MIKLCAEIKLWGNTVGTVAMAEGGAVAEFRYDPAFVRHGPELAPLAMPLADTVYAFPALGRAAFRGLPGLLADALPDKFGSALVDAWLASKGRAPGSCNAVERLCFTGARGMGALEFQPAEGLAANETMPLELDRLVELAAEVLTCRNNLQAAFGGDEDRAIELQDLLLVGTSAGGARAKAVIAWNPSTGEVRPGHGAADPGFEPWLLKFDGVAGNRDKEQEDPQGYGVIEYAYHRMATDAGIRMSACRLLEENGRRHFMTRRFDRRTNGVKLHMQSLGGLAHFDYNLAGRYAYEQAFLVIRQLGLSEAAVEEQFRRMVFNVIARNQDDHVKNIAFLMDSAGDWFLAPAYDVTFSFRPTGRWTAVHQMTLNGKRDGFTLDDFRACAETVALPRGRAEAIVAEVHDVVSRWPEYAEEAGVAVDWRDAIAACLRLDPFA